MGAKKMIVVITLSVFILSLLAGTFIVSDQLSPNNKISKLSNEIRALFSKSEIKEDNTPRVH